MLRGEIEKKNFKKYIKSKTSSSQKNEYQN
jgi:hypothetical protein